MQLRDRKPPLTNDTTPPPKKSTVKAKAKFTTNTPVHPATVLEQVIPETEGKAISSKALPQRAAILQAEAQQQSSPTHQGHSSLALGDSSTSSGDFQRALDKMNLLSVKSDYSTFSVGGTAPTTPLAALASTSYLGPEGSYSHKVSRDVD